MTPYHIVPHHLISDQLQHVLEIQLFSQMYGHEVSAKLHACTCQVHVFRLLYLYSVNHTHSYVAIQWIMAFLIKWE